MEAREEDARVFLEEVLCSVSVVNIEVQDGDAL
jgi:hypothetical protein